MVQGMLFLPLLPLLPLLILGGRGGGGYSYLNASSGSTLVARRAGR
jgi:hypothetical protein